MVKRRSHRSPTTLCHKEGSALQSKKENNINRRFSRGRRVYFAPSSDVVQSQSAGPEGHFDFCSKTNSQTVADCEPFVHLNSRVASGRNSRYNRNMNKSCSHRRWKQLMLKRLRAKDNRILHILKSRPPPPTVGHSGTIELSDDERDHASGINKTIPDISTCWFDEGHEKDAEGINQPIDNSSPLLSHPPDHLQPTTANNGTFRSLDLFGSYLQNYKQSDFNISLFDENMLIS